MDMIILDARWLLNWFNQQCKGGGLCLRFCYRIPRKSCIIWGSR